MLAFRLSVWPPDVDYPDPDAFTHSPPVRAVDEMIDHVASTDATVLVWGESGVGKEVVARTIHLRSPRRDRPFVKVNCAALPLELLESELFGYERNERVSDFEEIVRLDCQYIGSWSIWPDVQILAKTVVKVMRHSGW